MIFSFGKIRHKFVAQPNQNGFPSGFFERCGPIQNIVDLFLRQRFARGRFFYEVFYGVGRISPLTGVPKDFSLKAGLRFCCSRR